MTESVLDNNYFDKDKLSEEVPRPADRQPVPRKLVFPTSADVESLRRVMDPADYKVISDMQENFNNANEIIIPIGDFGLGDAIIDTRFVILAALKSNKKIRCQVPPSMFPIVSTIGSKVSNLRFVDRIAVEELFDPGNFFLRFQSGRFSSGSLKKWLDDPKKVSADIRTRLDELEKQRKLGYWHHFITPLRNSTDANFYTERLNNAPVSEVNYERALMLLSLGIRIKEADLIEHPIFNMPPQELREIPQDLNMIIIPDAKEFETKDRYRSRKSLDVSVWREYFRRLGKRESPIGIVRGVSHPEYCDDVIQAASESGVDIEVIEGDLLHLSHQMLRAKVIIGMDSGPTHLAQDIKSCGRKYDRQVEIRSVFYDINEFFQAYGIVDAPTYLTYDNMTAEDVQGLIRFMG